MINISILKTHLFLALLFLALFSNQTIADVVKESGTIAFIDGDAWANQPNLPQRTLSNKSVVYENDVIKTGKKSSLTVLFKDDTKFDLGPESDLLITKFRYERSPDEDSITVKMLRGSFRFISGLIAKDKPKSMSVGTTVATIGIRGTHVAGEVDETSAKIMLMEKEDQASPNKIEVYNDFGSVTIDEPGYGTEIPDQFSPPSPPRRMRLQTINNLTRSIQRINTPRPRPRF
jgi:FecR-like protein